MAGALGSLRALPITATFALLTISGASWQSAGNHLASPPLDVVDRFGVRLVDVAAGEWWRVLSAAFISSAGWPHAVLNVLGAGLVVRPLEREHGTRCAVFVLLVSAVAAFAGGVQGHGVHWLSAGGSGLVLGCAGFTAVRWAVSSRQARAGTALVLAATVVLPALLAVTGIEPRGSVPAHLGGFVAGAVVGVGAAFGRLISAAAAVMTLSLVSTIVVLVPLLPRPADLVSCQSDAVSASDRGPETRLLFRSDRNDVAVRWISPTGVPGRKYAFTDDRRGRMPWYGYEGALYEVVDAKGDCLVRARATRWTSSVDISR